MTLSTLLGASGHFEYQLLAPGTPGAPATVNTIETTSMRTSKTGTESLSQLFGTTAITSGNFQVILSAEDTPIETAYSAPSVISLPFQVTGSSGFVVSALGADVDTPPMTPTNLVSAPRHAGEAVLGWTASRDLETPSQELTYNLSVGTHPGSDNVISTQNLGKTTSYTVTDLPDGTYYWSVQASDPLATTSEQASGSFALGGTIFASWSNMDGAAGATNLQVTLSTPLSGGSHFNYLLLAPGTTPSTPISADSIDTTSMRAGTTEVESLSQLFGTTAITSGDFQVTLAVCDPTGGSYVRSSNVSLPFSVTGSGGFVPAAIAQAINTPPTTPGNTSASFISAGKVKLQWDAANDSETQQSELTYTVRVGTRPGDDDIISTQSIGKATDYIVSALPDGTYYWSVQASDSFAATSSFTDSSFALGGTIFASWDNADGSAGAANIKVTLATPLGANSHFGYQLLAPGTPGAPRTVNISETTAMRTGTTETESLSQLFGATLITSGNFQLALAIYDPSNTGYTRSSNVSLPFSVVDSGFVPTAITASLNTPPTTPTNLTAEAVGSGKAVLRWDASNDFETQQSNLTYTVRVGTRPGTDNVISTRNIGKTTSYTIRGLSGGTYYWGVEARDSLSAVSGFAADSSFAITAKCFISLGIDNADGGFYSVTPAGIKPTAEEGVNVAFFSPTKAHSSLTYTLIRKSGTRRPVIVRTITKHGIFSGIRRLSLPTLFGSPIRNGDYMVAVSVNQGVSRLLFELSPAGRAVIPAKALAVTSPPTVPTRLATTAKGNRATLTWAAAKDFVAASESLGYRLRVGTRPNKFNILSTKAIGRTTSYTLRGLHKGTYYWSVQAINPHSAHSTFSASRVFRLR